MIPEKFRLECQAKGIEINCLAFSGHLTLLINDVMETEIQVNTLHEVKICSKLLQTLVWNIYLKNWIYVNW